jgi:hypothetical protein
MLVAIGPAMRVKLRVQELGKVDVDLVLGHFSSVR